MYISIHAPTRGATRKEKSKYMPVVKISIHAPTRGATSDMLITTQNLGNFNPRSHERSDGRREAEQRETLISIHAPTRGATKARGADNGVTIISIHAPTRGATALVLSLRPLQMYFNPRSHERSD